jgi:methylphosphotriester-DNA--protein-cysteine methyltransferase
MRPVIEAEAAGFRPCQRCEPNGRFEKRLTREGGAA